MSNDPPIWYQNALRSTRAFSRNNNNNGNNNK